MKINGIIWFDDIIEKLIRKHNVEQHDVREVLANKKGDQSALILSARDMTEAERRLYEKN